MPWKRQFVNPFHTRSGKLCYTDGILILQLLKPFSAFIPSLRMAETKAKKRVATRRPRAKAANSPIPGPRGSTCGHSNCKDACNVRYCGPTSHPRDHLLHKAAHGAGHVWMASVVAGLAVVVTMSIAYTAAQAKPAPGTDTTNQALSALWRKMDNMERLLKQIAEEQGINEEDSEQDPASTLFPAP